MVKKISIGSKLLIYVLILFYLLYIYFFSVEFPFQDDTALIDFIYTVEKSEITLKEFFNALLRVDNDHSMAVPRLISWLDYFLNGWLSFRWLILYAAFQTVLILYFFFNEFSKLKLPIFYFLPVPFFLLQPQYFEVSNFALTGIQHTSLIVYLFIALYSIRTNKSFKNLVYSLLIASLSTFTHGNGILVFASVALYLLFTKRLKQIIWVAVFLGANLVLYLHYYSVGQAAQMTRDYSVILRMITGLMGGINIVFGEKGVELGIVLGILLCTLFTFLMTQEILYKKNDITIPNNRILLAIIFFSFLTICLISIVRSWKGMSITSRFQFYSAVVIIATYLLLLPKFNKIINRSIFFISSLTFSTLFYLYSFHSFTRVMEHQKLTYIADSNNWYQHREMFVVGHTFVEKIGVFIHDSFHEKVWKVPTQILNKDEFDTLKNTQKMIDFNAKPIRNEIKIQEKKGYWTKVNYTLEMKGFKENGNLSKQWFAVLENKNHLYISPLLFVLNTKKEFLNSGNYFSKNANILIQNDSVDEGIYQLYLVKIKKTKQLFDTNKTIEFLREGNKIRMLETNKIY